MLIIQENDQRSLNSKLIYNYFPQENRLEIFLPEIISQVEMIKLLAFLFSKDSEFQTLDKETNVLHTTETLKPKDQIDVVQVLF